MNPLVALHAAAVSAWANQQDTPPAHAAGAMANLIPVLMTKPELLADEAGLDALDKLMRALRGVAEHCASALGMEVPADDEPN